jgi:carbamoyltransferase
MLVLSINFGHDASLCIFKDGNLLDFLEVERESRLKHHLGISSKRIENYLSSNGLSWNQIDFVCLSGTQFWGNFSTSDFEINYGYALEHKKYFEPSTLYDLTNFQFGDSYGNGMYREQILQQQLVCNPTPIRTKWFLNTLARPDASNPVEVANLVNFYRDLDDSKSKQFQARFFCPLVVKYNGRKVPGFFVDHHAAHANYAAYYAKKNSLIATHDGGLPNTPYNSGGIYLNFHGGAVYPIVSHGLALGNIYDLVALTLGLDAGKLMGLASYARPNKHIAHVASQYLESVRSGSPLTSKYVGDIIFATAQIDQSIRKASVKKFSFNIKGVPLEIALQAAANTQALVQYVYVSLVSEIAEKIHEADDSVRTAYMTGGFSLNCPTNSLINHVSTSIEYKPLPAVGDTGISIGAAVAFYKFMSMPSGLGLEVSAMAPAFPPSYRSRLNEKIDLNNVSLLCSVSPESIQDLVNELSKGKVICIHQGRSEVGPRALGHRSIIGWAGDESVRDRINSAKGREAWRPLAPMVLRKDFDLFFSGDPDQCSYMLTVSKVKNSQIPAVTHVDNTARVQVLDENELFLVHLLHGLNAKGIAPVLVNTSFNCSGEPLVESLADSVRSFSKMKFDFLVLDTDIYIPRSHFL